MHRVINRSHEGDQLFVYDFHELLGRVEQFHHPFAEGLLGNFVHELANDAEADVGFEKRLLHEPQPLAHIRFGQLPFASQGSDRGKQAVLKCFKHRNTLSR